MRTNPYQTYVEDEILTADPVKLIQLLYRRTAECVSEAREKLAAGDIKGRSAAITKAIEILAELSFSLDHVKGGELSARLAALYDYMQRRLIEANQQQLDAALVEVQTLAGVLDEAWSQVEAPAGLAMTPPRGKPVEMDEDALGHMAPADYVPLSCAC